MAVNLFLTVWNLCPFLRLDGYWALSAAVDVPNLRTKAMRYLGESATSVLVRGERPPPPGPGPAAWLLFAGGCVVFTPLVSGVALANYRSVLLGAGRPGAVLWLLLAGALVAWLTLRALQALTHLWRAGTTAPSRVTVALGLGLILTVVALIAHRTGGDVADRVLHEPLAIALGRQ